MSHRKRQLQRYDSSQLKETYQKHINDMISKPNIVQSDDAFQLSEANSSKFGSLFKSIIIIGSYPWEDESQKRILYQYPPTVDVDEIKQRTSFIQFVLPEIKRMNEQENPKPPFDEKESIEKCGLNHPLFRTYDSILYKLDLIDNNRLAQPKFVPLYFPSPSSSDAPFLFCLHFYCSPFNLPSICHNFTMNELSKHVTETRNNSHFDLKLTRLAICVQTQVPFYDLFEHFFEWLLSCELYTRMKHFQQISDFCDSMIDNSNEQKADPFPIENDWLQEQRTIMNELIQLFAKQPIPPTPNSTVTVSRLPFTAFHWTRPNAIVPYFSLATVACKHLVTFLQTPKKFVQLFFALLLEHSILVYSDYVSSTAWFIICLHLLLAPLRWTLPSISLIPSSLNELIYSPVPNILGLTTEFDQNNNFDEIPKESFYIDLKRSVFLPPTDLIVSSGEDCTEEGILSSQGLTIPLQSNFLNDVEKVWSCDMGLILVSNKFVSTFLQNAKSCIITNGVDPNNIYSKFMEEKFLLDNFIKEERPLAHDIMKSQMFRYYIEQQCRLKTDQVKKKYKKI